MRWVGCPLCDVDGTLLHPPSCSDDEDDDNVADLLNRREGHCAAVLTHSAASDGIDETSLLSWVVVCGGYSKGSVSAVPLVAPTALLPVLQWRELPEVEVFECDGASLTTLDATASLALLPGEAACEHHSLLPLPSSRTAAVAYLFGGFDSEMNLRNALFTVTLYGHSEKHGDKETWTPTAVRVAEMCCTGDVPTPRARHGAGGCDGRLFIFGGETATEEQTSDLYVCDVCTGVWRAVAASAPARPAPRLLSLSLVFVSPTTFVLYGGCHFVDGAVQSFADAWRFDIDVEAWTQVVEACGGGSLHTLPRSNGHAGGAVVLPAAASASSRFACAVFVGGKDVAEGDDRVKMIRVSSRDAAWEAEVCVRPALPTLDTGSCPHWRYTPAVVTTEKGLLLLAGQCRHAQVPSSFLLSFD